MKKSLLLSALLSMALAGNVSAEGLTAQQALNRFLSGNADRNTAAKVRRAVSVNKMRLAYTSKVAKSNTYYVFNNMQEGGFVILSAEDKMPAVLGVVDNGQFDYDKIPSNMKWYLGVLDSAVKAQAARGGKVTTISENAIEPLLGKTQWDQGKPFNLLVPEYEYGEKGKEQAPVGCVACATAQIMRHHKHPSQGVGGETSYKFVWDTKAGQDQQVATDSTEFSTNFEEHTYDWANMIDKYDSDKPNWTEEQGNAVSILLKDIGVAAKMRYGTSASGGSGTQTYETMRGMVDHFDYDASMQFVRHKFYTNDEWDNMIYAELSNNRPVMFGGNGVNGTGGHEFVCDGFDGNGKFHINWGWSGFQDGYFLLTGPGLIPAGTGSGGAAAGSSYGYDLEAAIGIKPNDGGSMSGSYANAGYTCKLEGKKLTLMGKFFNMCYRQRKDTVGIQIKASDGTNYNFKDAVADLNTNSDCSSIDVELDAVAAGEYTIVPIFKGKDDENWTEMKILSTFKAATLKYENEAFEVTNNDAPKIEAEGSVTANKKSFRPRKKNADTGEVEAAEDEDWLVLSCEAGIKNCDEKGQKLQFGCEFYDLTESTDEMDVYWLSNYAKTNADELPAGSSIKEIKVEILPELEVGHSYEISPIFYVGVDESLGEEEYWEQLDNQAQYVQLSKDQEAIVIDITADGESTGIKSVSKATTFDATTAIYDISGRTIAAKNVESLPQGTYIVKDARGVRKIVKK